MAEYCAQCAKKYGMSNGLISESKPDYLATVIFECCGVIKVNYKDECVSHDYHSGSYAINLKNLK